MLTALEMVWGFSLLVTDWTEFYDSRDTLISIEWEPVMKEFCGPSMETRGKTSHSTSERIPIYCVTYVRVRGWERGVNLDLI